MYAFSSVSPTEDLSSNYTFSSHTFTNCTATGRHGPTLSECRTEYGGDSSDWWNDTTNNYLDMNNDNGIQIWTVPKTGEYKIEAWGASGGAEAGGGIGAPGSNVTGEFILESGDKYMILVGQTSQALAVVTNVRLVSDIGANLLGSMYIPDPDVGIHPRFETGEKVLTFIDKSNLDIDNRFLDKINKFASIKHISENP